MTTALMAIGLIVALMVTAKRSAPAYGAASVLVLGVAAWSAFGELSADGGQWASDSARITALGLNAIGILGAASRSRASCGADGPTEGRLRRRWTPRRLP
jgi:hypothetical protein